ncbi:YtxH domain-containing protein [Ferruginibacter albus]|uniref:YtxH domain-containing protein n=1 Tax=Ferruginibacter albus TaxID=2875540 RepID=UPI001CC5ED80|nr:YtxH domain-containing protein [Ferruginibacter albus]UAY51089.1 YtxH domain-containing protein [Ferruginibacter albus]
MSNRKIAASFLSGIAIGAIAGLLCAPDEGTKVRKKILQKSEDITKALKWSVTTIREALMREYKEAEEAIAGATDFTRSETSIQS